MKLYAAGFNAWNQLALDPSAVAAEPRDLDRFAQVYEADLIETPVARLTYTLGTRILTPRPPSLAYEHIACACVFDLASVADQMILPSPSQSPSPLRRRRHQQP
jgi:hypothetical protein